MWRSSSAVPQGPWSDAPEEALLLPLATTADTAPRGVLILAVNPYRRRGDDSFENFAALVARQIASAIVTSSLEAERERAKSADSLALEIEHRRRIERHQNLLLDELNHRVKNTLATVQAMAIQTIKAWIWARAMRSWRACSRCPAARSAHPGQLGRRIAGRRGPAGAAALARG